VTVEVTEMLLWLSSGEGAWLGGDEEPEEFAADVALEDADDLAAGVSFGGAAGEIFAGSWVVTEAGQGDGVEGAVEAAVAAPVEPVTAENGLHLSPATTAAAEIDDDLVDLLVGADVRRDMGDAPRRVTLALPGGRLVNLTVAQAERFVRVVEAAARL
jgi:hypothetical protein